jgi:WD40 repeat protein
MKFFIIIFIFILFILRCDFDYNNPVDPDVRLPSPGILQSSQDGEWIRLDWNTHELYRTGYQIMRMQSDTYWENIKHIENKEQTTYLDTTIQSNIIYYYRICGKADANSSHYSNIINIKADFTAPYAITYYSVSENSLQLNWEDSCSFEDGFKIMRKLSSEQAWIVAGSVKNEQDYFIDTGLEYNTSYVYYIVGFTDHNESLQSDKYYTKVILTPPSDLTAAPLSDHEIQLNWKDNSLYETGFKLERRNGITDNWLQIAELDANILTYRDTKLISEKEYAYRIKAFSTNHESDFSNQSIGKTEFPAPLDLQVNSISTYSAKISWIDNCSYETGYIFKYVVKDQRDTITIQLPADANEYTLDDIYNGEFYNIKIKAKTEYNVSRELTGTVGFSDNFTWMDVPALSGNKVNSIAFSMDGSLMILGREGNDCDIWNTDAWSLVQSVQGNTTDESANIIDAVLAPNNLWLAMGTLQGSVRILNNDGWSEVNNLYLNAYPLTSCQFSIDNNYLAVAQYKFIYLWNTIDWSFSSTLSEHTDQITDIDFSPNGEWFASGGNDNKIIIWSTENWSDLYTLSGHSDNITNLCFSPNSQYLVSGSANGEIRKWSTIDWADSTLLPSETGAIKAITFSNDNKWLAVAYGESGAIKLWYTYGWIQFPGPTGANQQITALKYTPDGSRLVAALANGSINIWNLEGAWKLIEN